MNDVRVASTVVRIAIVAATVAAVFSWSAPARAQSSSLQLDLGGVTEGAFPDASVVVNLEDTSGTALGVLTPANVVVTVAGRPSTVKSVELASTQKLGIDVLLLNDTSGSMEGAALAAAKTAAKEFIRGLNPEDRVAVMRYANSVTLEADYTSDKAVASAAIDGLVAKGQTELYKAIDAAATKTADSTSARRVVVLLTDGASDAIITGVTAEGALQSAAIADVPFYTILQGDLTDGAEFLTELARITGGRYLEAPTPGDLSGVYADIGRLLRNQYVVTFDASAAAGQASAPVTVQVSANGRTAAAAADFVPGAAFSAPKVTLIGVTAGETLAEPRELTATTESTLPVTEVSFYVDGVNVHETAAQPYTYSFDPEAFGGGEHAVHVEVQFGALAVATDPVTFIADAPEVAPPDAEGGGSSLPVIPIAAGIGGLVLLAGGFVGLQSMRRRIASPKLVAAEQRIVPWHTGHRPISSIPVPPKIEAVEAEQEDIGEPLGVLVARSGPHIGSEYQVGPKPVSVGSGTTCGVRIPGMGGEEARIWVRDGHLMVHKMTRLTLIASDGISGGWTILEPGDRFDIGEHSFEFKLLPQGAPAPDATPSADTPDILRDRTPAPPSPLGPMQPQISPSAIADTARIWPSELQPDPPSIDQDDDGLTARAG